MAKRHPVLNYNKNKIAGVSISPDATKANLGKTSNNETPVFSFKYVHKKYPLDNWGKRNIKSLIRHLQQMEDMTWNRIIADGRDGVLKYTQISQDDLPEKVPGNVSPDVSIIELTVGDPCRLFGFRTGRVLNIIWFDKNHDVYCMS
jgi:hypothetical protein